jgi:hypothetical protein
MWSALIATARTRARTPAPDEPVLAQEQAA